jgi:NRAMP (natural resistance-associated macrophage protein)-like metal ion transporter
MTAGGPQPQPTARRSRRRWWVAFVAVLGPGLLAGLSDDDPAGITTYSVLGAEHGYQLLWVLLVSTIALVVFHSLGARLGVVTGQGLIGLIRQRYGVGSAAGALGALLVANLGTTAAELAGIAAGFQLFGVDSRISVPVAALIVSGLVLRGGFHRVEHVLMAIATVFVAYVAAGILAHPDWGAAARGLTTPTTPMNSQSIVIITATVGTTLAPWGLSFIQSYAVDKRITTDDLGLERVDVVTGASLTGVIGFFVVVACAATLHANGVTIDSADDAAGALEPVAGSFASGLFAIGLIGAALLAAAVLPLSTAYSVCEFSGSESALDDAFSQARTFYFSYIVVMIVGAAAVLLPGIPLVGILVFTQVLNAVLLLPLLVFMVGISRDADLMGDHRATRAATATHVAVIVLVTACVLALLVVSVAG